MTDSKGYLLVDSSVLPDVFSRVVEAKRLLRSGECKTTSEAAERMQISRSAFYKYKDKIFELDQMGKDKILTLFFEVVDKEGVLSKILSVLSGYNTNILTINQNIPVDNSASITISVRTRKISCSVDELIEGLKKCDGVRKIKILAGE